MEPTRLRLGELLVDARIITPEQLAEVLEIQKEDGRRLGILLVERGLVNETQLTQILSQQLSVPWVSLYHVDFSKRLLSMVPRDVAVKYCLVPIYVRHVRGQGDTLYVAMFDPTNVEALRICAAWSGLPTRAMIASPSDIRNAIDVYYGPGPEGQECGASEGSQETPPPQGVRPETEPSPAKADDEAPSSAEETSVAVSAEQGPVEERFAPSEHAEHTASDAAPSPTVETSQVEEGQAPPAEPEPESTRTIAGYDDSVTVEVGQEVPIEEVLSRRPPPGPEDEQADQAQPARTKSGKMIALTLLDGTTLALPVQRQAKKVRRDSLIKALRAPQEEPATAQEPQPEAQRVPSSVPPARQEDQEAPSAQPTDLVAALRAIARGTEPATVLGDGVGVETVLASVISLLLRKGLISDDELTDELKKG